MALKLNRAKASPIGLIIIYQNFNLFKKYYDNYYITMICYSGRLVFETETVYYNGYTMK